jgi:hypothetical protein
MRSRVENSVYMFVSSLSLLLLFRIIVSSNMRPVAVH